MMVRDWIEALEQRMLLREPPVPDLPAHDAKLRNEQAAQRLARELQPIEWEPRLPTPVVRESSSEIVWRMWDEAVESLDAKET